MVKTATITLLALVCISNLKAQQFQNVTSTTLTSENQKSFGTTWIDYDNDGDLDLFMVNMGEDNALFRNNGSGIFTKMTSDVVGTLVQDGGNSFTASWADFNNDGRVDVFVGNFSEPSFLYTQEADHKFVRTHQNLLSQNIAAVQACSWVDFDLDGDLDLFIGTKEQPNLFFENDGAGGLKKTSINGLTNSTTSSHGIAWTDLNDDNYPDLFLAENIESDNMLYLSRRNSLEKELHNYPKSVSIGATWVDYDNDLDMDLFVTNAMGKPDQLYENTGNGQLKLIANDPLVLATTNSMGACWGDYDNDGDQDVFIANSENQKNSLFENKGEQGFGLMNETALKSNVNASRGCSAGDVDNDGDLDLYVTNGFGENDQNEFYENLGNANNWVKLRLSGIKNSTPIGTKITLKTGDGSVGQLREISSTTGAYGHNSHEVHFGIGATSKIMSLTIRWPNGNTQIFESVAPNMIYVLKEGENLKQHN